MSTPRARAAYREVTALLARGELGEARRRAALAVQATAANLPPCVQPGPAQGSTFTVLFRPGEALRLLTSVGGGRVNLYELMPEGVPPVLNGPLEAYSFSPFAGALFVDVVSPDGKSRRVRTVNLDRQHTGWTADTERAGATRVENGTLFFHASI